MSTTNPSSGSPSVPLYGGWQRERMGFLFGLSGTRFAVAAAAMILAAVPLWTGSVDDLAVTGPIATLLAATVWLRVYGKPATEWAGVGWGFAVNKLLHRDLFLSGAFAPRAATEPTAPAPMDLPGPLASLGFLEADTSGLLGALAPHGRIAVVHNPLERTFTAVARIRCPGIALADSDRREARVGGWGSLLAQLCNEASPFSRISVVQRTVPDDGTALRRWTADALDPNAPAVARQVIDELTAQARLTASAHEMWLALSLDENRARNQIRAAGGGQIGALAVLVRQLAAVSTTVGAAHLEVVEWLPIRELAAVVRTAFDPSAVVLRAGSGCSTSKQAAGVDPRLCGPAAAQAAWGHYRHDGAFSVSYVIQDWPRTGVPAWFLSPVLSAQHIARRSFALHVQPVPGREAEKLLMRARTKRAVAVRLRQRSGQIVPEHELLAEAQAHAQDSQRAEGHGLVRFVGYLTVSVTDPAHLELACSELETDAGRANLVVRRLWGAQDVGFHAAALPLGYGLPKRKAVA